MNRRYSLFFGLILLAVGPLSAQVQFKIALLEDGKTYQVSMVSEKTFDNPMNLTSTAQITIKAPTSGLNIDQFYNLQEGVVWEPSSLNEAPTEAPNADYHSFSLVSQGTNRLSYVAGQEVPLFAFTNKNDCQGSLRLMSNALDPFLPPNSRQANVGNQITVLGAQGDAYIGNVLDGSVPCDQTTSIEQISQLEVDLSFFPNPVQEQLTVRLNWERPSESVEIVVRHLNGAVLLEQTGELVRGGNVQRVDVRNLAAGSYLLEMRGKDWQLTSEAFLKLGK